FRLPAIVRLGVEGRNQFGDKSLLRVEATYVREFWSAHDSFDIIPDNVQLLNITGFPSPFAVAPISLPRNFEDTHSFRLGAEYSLDLWGYTWDLRLGGSYEKSAIPPAWLSPLTIDLDKLTVGL